MGLVDGRQECPGTRAVEREVRAEMRGEQDFLFSNSAGDKEDRDEQYRPHKFAPEDERNSWTGEKQAEIKRMADARVDSFLHETVLRLQGDVSAEVRAKVEQSEHA